MAKVKGLTGEERILDLADRMRASGGHAEAAKIYHECVQCFVRGEISFDEVTPLFRHGAIHAGAVKRVGSPYVSCPICHVTLREEDGGGG